MEAFSCGDEMNRNTIEKLKGMLSSTDLFHDLADFFKVFSDPTRVKILYALTLTELCVCDISSVIDANQSAVSHQLRFLKQMRVVNAKREGKTICYSLNDEHIKQLLDLGISHVKE